MKYFFLLLISFGSNAFAGQMPVMCKAAQLIPESPSEAAGKNCGTGNTASEFLRDVQKASNKAKTDREIGCAKLNEFYQAKSNRFIETKTLCEMIQKNIDSSLAAVKAQKANITKGDNQAALSIGQNAIAESEKCIGQLGAIKSEVDAMVTKLYDHVKAVNTLKYSKKLEVIRDLSKSTNQGSSQGCSVTAGKASNALDKTMEYFGGVRELFVRLQVRVNAELSKYQKK